MRSLIFASVLFAAAFAAPQLDADTSLRRIRRNTEEEVTSAVNLITSTKSSLQVNDNKDVIVVLGLQSTGKSTLIKFLTTDLSGLTAIKKKAGYYHISSTQAVAESPYEDFIPQLTVDDSSQVYYDCPSFKRDNINSSVDVASAYFIKQVFDNAEKVKIVFTVTQKSFQSENRNVIETLFSQINKLIPDVNVFKDSIAVAVTKIAPSADEVIFDQIITSLNEVKSNIAITDETVKQNWLNLIDIITAQKDGKYLNIGLFKAPTKEGTLNLDEVMQTSKTNLVHVIHHKLQYGPVENGNTGFVLSKDENNDILSRVVPAV